MHVSKNTHTSSGVLFGVRHKFAGFIFDVRSHSLLNPFVLTVFLYAVLGKKIV